MNTKNLFDAIGKLSDDLVAEAAAPQKMKRIKLSRVLVLAAALIMLLGLTTWASKFMVTSRVGHSRSTPDYYTVPSAAELRRDTGIAPNIPDSFSNGYSFSSAHIGEDSDYGENGALVENYKSISCKYVFGDESLSVYIDAAKAGIGMEDEETAASHKGTEIKYASFQNKFVPADYQLTAEDEEDQRTGKYVFSYGTDAIEIVHVQVTAFEHHGLNYSICALDSSLTRDELIQMAKEIIDYQK